MSGAENLHDLCNMGTLDRQGQLSTPAGESVLLSLVTVTCSCQLLKVTARISHRWHCF